MPTTPDNVHTLPVVKAATEPPAPEATQPGPTLKAPKKPLAPPVTAAESTPSVGSGSGEPPDDRRAAYAAFVAARVAALVSGGTAKGEARKQANAEWAAQKKNQVKPPVVPATEAPVVDVLEVVEAPASPRSRLVVHEGVSTEIARNRARAEIARRARAERARESVRILNGVGQTFAAMTEQYGFTALVEFTAATENEPATVRVGLLLDDQPVIEAVEDADKFGVVMVRAIRAFRREFLDAGDES